MIPKETKCPWCGKWIFCAPKPTGGKMELNSSLTPFKRRLDKESGPYLYDRYGNQLPAEALPFEREAEAEGYGHTAHFCVGPPRRPRPLSKKEKWAMAREEL